MTQSWLSFDVLLFVLALATVRAAVSSIRGRGRRDAVLLARAAELLEVLPGELGPLLGVDPDVVACWTTRGVPLRRFHEVRQFEQSVRRLRQALPPRTAFRLLAVRRRWHDEQAACQDQLETRLRTPPAAAPMSTRRIGRGPIAGALVTLR